MVSPSGPRRGNLVGIYAALEGTDAASVLNRHGGSGFGPFKNALAELATERLAPIAAETRRLLADSAYVEGVLRSGSERAASIANPIVAEAERLVGFLT